MALERVIPAGCGDADATVSSCRWGPARRLSGGVDLSEAETLNGARAECGEPRAEEVSLAQGSGHREFQEIFDRYARPVTAFLRDLLGDWSAAEELTQETFVRAYRGRAAKRADTRISTWLFGIALNVAREALRARYRRRAARGLEDPACQDLKDERRSPADNVIDQEVKRAIQSALARLSEAQRTVFVLKVVNQMRYQEITAITGARIGKLKTDLHRARLEMRRLLEPYVRGRVPGMRGDS